MMRWTIRFACFLWLGLGALGCAVGQDAQMAEKGQGDDPLVRQRVILRMDELLDPLKDDLQYFHGRTHRGPEECEKLCSMVESFCDVGDRVCVLASDYPKDEEIQNKCAWASTDCGEARAACRSCQGRH